MNEAVVLRLCSTMSTCSMTPHHFSVTPLVSVIVPVFNGEHTLGACLDSILGQSLSDINVIVVDDASVDGSREIVAEYSAHDSRVKLLTNATNMKSYGARIRGINHACGRYIGACDCDDQMPRDALRQLFNAAERSGADIVHGRARELCSGRGLPVYDPLAVKTGEAFVMSMLRNFRGWNLWGKLFRGDVLRRAVCFLPEGCWHTADDLLICFAMGLEKRLYGRFISYAVQREVKRMPFHPEKRRWRMPGIILKC